MADINNDKIASMKIKKIQLTFNDEKIENDYFNANSGHLIIAFGFYIMNYSLFWIIDIIFSIYYGLFKNEIITKILKILNIIIGIIIYI